MNGKKALAAEQLVVIILLIAAFVLIAATSSAFQKKARFQSKELLCQDSIALRAANTVRIGQIELASPLSPVLCETIYRKIDGDREKLKGEIASMMARCWEMFGEGRYEEIEKDPEYLRRIFGIPAGENNCFLCYEVFIAEKEIPGGPISREEMEKYLMETNYPKKGIDYLNYIQSGRGPGQVLILDGIGPKEAYGVVFMSKNKPGRGLAWYDYVQLGIATIIAPAMGPLGIVAAGALPALRAKRTFYDSPERDVSVIVFDHLKSIQYGKCEVRKLTG